MATEFPLFEYIFLCIITSSIAVRFGIDHDKSSFNYGRFKSNVIALIGRLGCLGIILIAAFALVLVPGLIVSRIYYDKQRQQLKQDAYQKMSSSEYRHTLYEVIQQNKDSWPIFNIGRAGLLCVDEIHSDNVHFLLDFNEERLPYLSGFEADAMMKVLYEMLKDEFNLKSIPNDGYPDGLFYLERKALAPTKSW